MKLTFCSPGDLAFYPQFSVLSPIYPRFIPNSAFYPQFRVLSPIPDFIPNSAFYPQFRVLSPIPVPHSVSAFWFRVLSLPAYQSTIRPYHGCSTSNISNFACVSSPCLCLDQRPLLVR